MKNVSRGCRATAVKLCPVWTTRLMQETGTKMKLHGFALGPLRSWDDWSIGENGR